MANIDIGCLVRWHCERVRVVAKAQPKARALPRVRVVATAQALQQEMGTAPFDEPASSFTLARAAIAAMREPTDEMIDAWIGAPGAIIEGWQAMIDAALEGK